MLHDNIQQNRKQDDNHSTITIHIILTYSFSYCYEDESIKNFIVCNYMTLIEINGNDETDRINVTLTL